MTIKTEGTKVQVTNVASMKKFVLDYLNEAGFPMSKTHIGPRSVDLLIGGAITTIPLTKAGSFRAESAMRDRLKRAIDVWNDTDRRQIDLEDLIAERASA